MRLIAATGFESVRRIAVTDIAASCAAQGRVVYIGIPDRTRGEKAQPRALRALTAINSQRRGTERARGGIRPVAAAEPADFRVVSPPSVR
jgi:hypothetical protein